MICGKLLESLVYLENVIKLYGPDLSIKVGLRVSCKYSTYSLFWTELENTKPQNTFFNDFIAMIC